MNTILVCYDESEASDRALARAAQLAEALGALLIVASVSSEPRAPVTTPVIDPASGGFAPTTEFGPLATGGDVPFPGAAPIPEELAQHQLEGAQRALAGRQIAAEYVAEIGDPADSLIDLADRRDVDLIVIGRREHGFVDRLLGRGVDESVVGRSTHDVLLVR